MNLIETLNSVRDALKKCGFKGGVIFGIIITIVILIGLYLSIDCSINYLSLKKENHLKKSFENYAQSNSENIKSFFKNSEKRQKELVSILYDLDVENSKKSIIMSIANREIDKLRIVTTLNNYALTEFRKDDFKSKDQEIINDVYKATGLILDNKFQESADLLINTYEELKSPDGDNMSIEILRYLTFSLFALNKKDEAKFWLDEAKKLKNSGKKNIEWRTYTESYFWVDLLDLWISIQENNITNANKAFDCLTKNANPEFLESKFIQHELNLSPEDKNKWNEYLNKLRER